MSSEVRFRERLWPPWWLWLLAAGWSLMLGVAFGAAVGPVVGLAVGVSWAAATVTALTSWALLVQVDADGLRVGRVALEPKYVGPASALDPEATRRARGVEADARAFIQLRGWVSGGVRMTVDDVRDPTPYWLVSSRRPDELVLALTAVRAQSRHDGTDGEPGTAG